MTPFNLLHYPALASQRRRFHRRWTSLAGLVVGAAVAGWSVQAAQESAGQLQLERIRLQKQWAAQNMQWQGLQKQQDLQKTWQLQSAHLEKLKHQHMTWLALHQTLQQEAGSDSVQFELLQLEGGKLALHGQAPNLMLMESTRTRFSQSFSQLPATNPLQLSLKATHNNGLTGHITQPFWALSSLVATPATGAAEALPPAGQPAALKTRLAFVWQSSWPIEAVGSTPSNAARSAGGISRGAP